MGSAQSTDEAAAPALKVDDGYFGVRVTANGHDSDHSSSPAQGGTPADLEAMYLKGRTDAAAEFQELIPAMGSQLYGEVNRRIEQNIAVAVEKEKKLAEKVTAKMNAAAPSNQKHCAKESEALKSCLGANKADPLVCGEVVKSFEQCVASAVQSAKRSGAAQ